MSQILDAEVRQSLEKLAEGLVPLAEWSGKPNRYVPPNVAELPWRNGERLTHARLGVLTFFEGLLRSSTTDALLLKRWLKIKAEPLRYFPMQDAHAWRQNRGLHQAPSFAIDESENVLTDSMGQHVCRLDFYQEFWPFLRTVIAQRKPADGAQWALLAKELHDDRCKEWRKLPSPKSSVFTEQFVRDVLYAILNLTNPVPEPWRSAILVELGEFRRAGNSFTREHVAEALERFKQILAEPAEPTQFALDVEPERLVAIKTHYLQFSRHRI